LQDNWEDLPTQLYLDSHLKTGYLLSMTIFKKMSRKNRDWSDQFSASQGAFHGN
jgi:hypothetical protein